MNNFKAALSNNTLDDDSFNYLYYINLYRVLDHFIQESHQVDNFCELLFRRADAKSIEENLFYINELIRLAIKNQNSNLIRGFFFLKYFLFTRKSNLKLNTYNEVKKNYEYHFMFRYQNIESLMAFKLTSKKEECNNSFIEDKKKEECKNSFIEDNKKEKFFQLAAKYCDKQDTFEILMDLQLVQSVDNPLKIAALNKNSSFIETFLAKANLDALIQDIKYKLQVYNDENFYDELEQNLSHETIIYTNIQHLIFIKESKDFKKVLVIILNQLIDDYSQLKESFHDCYNSDLILTSTSNLECFQILFHINYSVTKSDLLKYCLKNKYYDTFKYLINEFKQLNGIKNDKSKKLSEIINWKDNDSNTPSILHFALDQFEENEINYDEVKIVYDELFQLERLETNIFSSLFFQDQNILIKALSKKENHVLLKYLYEDKIFINSSFNFKIKDDIKILFIAIENCKSKNTLFYLIKMYKEKLNNNNDKNESPVDLLIQLKEKNSNFYLFDNTTIKQIIDLKESNLKFKLNHRSFQDLCYRNDTNLLKMYLENSDFNHKRDDFSVCFQTVIKNDKQKMSEMIANYIRDYNNKHLKSKFSHDHLKCIASDLIDYDSLKEILLVKKWWNVVEMLLDCINLTPKKQREKNEQIIKNMNIETLNKPLKEKFCFSFFDYCNESPKSVSKTFTNQDYTSLSLYDESPTDSENEFSIDNHPLILIAKSGQKSLIKHPTTLKYLELKWQSKPFLFYYTYTFFQILFMISFSFCVFKRIKSTTIATGFDHYWVLVNLFLSGIFYLFEIYQWIFIDGFIKYFNSIKNILELITYSLSTSILLKFSPLFKFQIKNDDNVYYLTPICILFGYIVLILCLEKMSLFGIYIVAFRESFKKSFKLLPIIVFLFIGFILAFKLNTIKMTKGLIDSTSLESVSRLSSLILSNLDPEKFDELGLDKSDYLSSYLVFFLFVLLMPILLINLLLAVSIDEFKTILKDAEIIQYQMKIEYTIKMLLHFKCRDSFFKNFDSEKDVTFMAKLIRFFHNLFLFVKKNFRNGIGFVDKSEKKLEDNLIELNKNLKLEIETSKDYLASQIADHDSKTKELSDLFESVKDILGDKIEKVHEKLNENDHKFKDFQDQYILLCLGVKNNSVKIKQ